MLSEYQNEIYDEDPKEESYEGEYWQVQQLAYMMLEVSNSLSVQRALMDYAIRKVMDHLLDLKKNHKFILEVED